MNNTNGAVFLDFNSICRTCLAGGGVMRPLYSNIKDEEAPTPDISTVADELAMITSITIDQSDGLPLNICESCVALIHSAYKFKLQFNRSMVILQEYILNEAKNRYKVVDVQVSEDDYHGECNVADDVLECVASFKPRRAGYRQTSHSQIEKRTTTVDHDLRTRRGCRKRGKSKNVEEYNSESNDEDSEVNAPARRHPCPICTKEFTALELREHAHTHKALKRYLSIPVAHRVRSTTRFYHKHNSTKETISIHNREQKVHKCVQCHMEFGALDLRVHLENHRNQKEYQCDQCERVFKQMNHLNTHRVKHLKEFPFKCEHCDKGFVIKTNYECHILTHDTNQELPHECSHCLKRFSNPEHLNRHIIIHTENVSYSVKYRVCKCHHCLKTFKDREELKKHHCVPIERTASTRYPCKICNKVFKNSSGLYNHNRNIHKLKGAKVLCSVCGNYVSNIYNHMMRHTGEKPFQCNQCGKRFLGKPQLKQHLLVHSGLKPYVCSVCAKAFNNLYNLQVHERIHVGDRCHICSICNKGFLEKSYLKKHMNVHTKL